MTIKKAKKLAAAIKTPEEGDIDIIRRAITVISLSLKAKPLYPSRSSHQDIAGCSTEDNDRNH
jgi:hypothetical protein